MQVQVLLNWKAVHGKNCLRINALELKVERARPTSMPHIGHKREFLDSICICILTNGMISVFGFERKLSQDLKTYLKETLVCYCVSICKMTIEAYK